MLRLLAKVCVLLANGKSIQRKAGCLQIAFVVLIFTLQTMHRETFVCHR